VQPRKSIAFADLLREAVTEPGTVSSAYSLFHGYSIGNALAAWSQCKARGIAPGPIGSFNRWKELGRHVRKGEKALMLCMPVTCKRERETEAGETTEDCFTRFVWRPNWFVLSQTEGPSEPPAVSLPDWNLDHAMTALEIDRVPFDHLDGNVQGYARGRSIAVSPIAENPIKTTLHEIAHVVLGHTTGDDTGTLDRSIGEVEAEGTAYIVASVLGVDGLENSRGYLQTWLNGRDVNEKTAARIFKTADAILKAGREEIKS